jgi:HAD superfamily hydrolase (TIGR01509 family)
MIKCIIFDLDGVLVDTKPIHFEALNNSLKKFFPNKIISYNDHIKFYDGLPTKEKLKILFGKNYTKNLKIILRIEKLKKINTAKILRSKIFFNKSTYDMFKKLAKKYDLMIATNAIKETLNICTSKLRINKFLSFKISNEDIKNSKPHPEIYMRCMLKGNFSTKETLVVEDSYFGRKSACDSGANLLPVNSTHDLTYKKIIEEIKRIDKQDQISQSQKWIDNDLVYNY